MGKLRILVAEDNAINQLVMQHVLTPIADDVCVVGDGQLACQKAQDWQPDLILMDIHMPVMDGLQATQRLKSTPATASIPVIALSGDARAEGAELALFAGYLVKPIDMDVLQQLLMDLQIQVS